MSCSGCLDPACDLCPDFESYVEAEEQTSVLKQLRNRLMKPGAAAYPWPQRFADWLVARVSTLKFFAFCIVLSLSPLVWQEQQNNVLYISNIFQLTLLPVILIAGARQAEMDRERTEREYRMMLVSERIQELRHATD